MCEGPSVPQGMLRTVWSLQIPNSERRLALRTYQGFRTLVIDCFCPSLVGKKQKLTLQRSHLMETLQDVFCDALVTKPLPHCEHTAQLACSQSPENHMCMTPCRRERPCCSKACPSACGQCQTLNTPDDDLYATTIPGLIVRKEHMSHTCKKTLYVSFMLLLLLLESHL
jgi:hypothetical protein